MSHKTSRWGDRNSDQNQHQHQHQHTVTQQRQRQTVSDEDAMKALLFSAESRSREREGRSNSDSSKRGGRGGRDGSRWERKGGSNNNHRDTDNVVSYYGPNGNSSDNNYDCKLKRPLEQRLSLDAPRRIEDDDGDNKDKETTTKAIEEDDEESRPPPEYKPNFGLSGALAKDVDSGNVYKGVVLKFKEPPEARAPNTRWRLYVFKPKQNTSKDADLIETLHISKQSAYLFGRNTDIADIPLLHQSLSSQHAVLQYRAMPVSSISSSFDGASGGPRLSCQPYIMDLESTNGTFLNGIRIDAARYYQLKRGDALTFGASTREYILLTENTTSSK